MYRTPFSPRHSQGERDFRWRGGDVSRIESLTDAVFALALTLIVVSLDVPQTYAELIEAFRQAPVFLACFAILYWIWVCHFQFHRRYGLEDPLTILMNAVLVFVVLLYVYPLKFLFTGIWNALFLGRGWVVLDSRGDPVLDANGVATPAFLQHDGGMLMVIYAAGYSAIFLLLALMTAHAARRWKVLELDERERLVTRITIREHMIQGVIGLASFVLALFSLGPAAGLIYFAIGPVMGIHGWLSRRAVLGMRPDGEP